MDAKPPPSSVNFDRAAEFYDQTRGHAAEISAGITSSLVRRLPPQAHLLEIGVGTGRISIPLIREGMRVIGLDLSSKMMARFVENLQPMDQPAALIQADAAQLPLASEIFDAVIAVHVFHLISGWEQALLEIRRVLKPDGAFFHGYDWLDSDTPKARIREKWGEIIRRRANAVQPGTRDMDAIYAKLIATGARTEIWSAVEWTETYNPIQHIEILGTGVFASSWLIPPEKLPECQAEIREWAAKEVGNLEQEVTLVRKFIWRRFVWR